MTDLNRGINDIARRRGFFRFGGAMALGLAGLASNMPKPRLQMMLQIGREHCKDAFAKW